MRTSARWVLLAGACGPLPALACAVCGQVTEQQNVAYLLMTLMLSAVPLLAMGAVAYWLYQRFQSTEHEADTPSPPSPPSSVPVAARLDPR